MERLAPILQARHSIRSSLTSSCARLKSRVRRRRETGWLGAHLVLSAADGTALGVAPCYLKSHSYGEYVFDHGWADAFERAGGRYYPKLQVERSLHAGDRAAAAGANARTARRCWLDELIGLCASDVGVVGPCHLPAGRGLGGARRHALAQAQDIQFHWHNQGYASFDAFLAALSSRKRKNIRKGARNGAGCGYRIRIG